MRRMPVSSWVTSDEMQSSGLTFHKGGFRLDISQNFLMDMVNRHLNGLPRVIAMSSSLEILN